MKISLSKPDAPTFYFIGVTTGSSSSRLIFPRWMEALGRPDVMLVGLDLPLQAEADQYRAVVEHIRREPLALGGLVTSHKIDLLAAASDLFDELGPDAQITGEVSSISKRGGRLIGRATDPVAGGICLDQMLGDAFFGRRDGEALILGAGGAGTALALHLCRKPKAADQPRRLQVVDRAPERLARLQTVVAPFVASSRLQTYVHDTSRQNDELLAALPQGSLIINATGMGKDRPGSPLSDGARFPRESVVWELNYRGELDFWHQAHAQAEARSLTVVDGWDYFIHGWTQVIGHVLHLEIGDELFARLSQIARRSAGA